MGAPSARGSHRRCGSGRRWGQRLRDMLRGEPDREAGRSLSRKARSRGAFRRAQRQLPSGVRANTHLPPLPLHSLAPASPRSLPHIVKASAPCMRPGGKIVGFHLNPTLAPLPANDPNLIVALSRLIDPVRVHSAGSPQSAKVLGAIRRAGSGGGHELVRAARIVLAQLRILTQTLGHQSRGSGDARQQQTPGPARPLHQRRHRGDHRQGPSARHLQAATGQTLAAAPPEVRSGIVQWNSSTVERRG